MDAEALRVAVYRSFAETGRAPSERSLAALLDASPGEVADGLQALAAARHVVLDADGRIVLAHPFAAIPLGFAVMGTSVLWWGGCAWDSFALPHLLPAQSPVLVATRCPGCRRPLAWSVSHESPPAGREVAHFLVPVAHIWDDVVRTCSHQRLFCDAGCVDDWLADSGQPRGSVLTLDTLWRLASEWYAGRLEPGYTRREPSAAADYFRHVGLRGAFWGLPAEA
jgi:hypothetical protein